MLLIAVLVNRFIRTRAMEAADESHRDANETPLLEVRKSRATSAA